MKYETLLRYNARSNKELWYSVGGSLNLLPTGLDEVLSAFILHPSALN
jgi:hypothetical protein